MQLLQGGTSEHLTLRILHPLQARLPIFRSPIALRHYDLHIPNLMKKWRCRDGTMSCFWPLTWSAGLNQGSSLERGLEQKLGIGHVAGGDRGLWRMLKLLKLLNSDVISIGAAYVFGPNRELSHLMKWAVYLWSLEFKVGPAHS
jgi:hypothetical protein